MINTWGVAASLPNSQRMHAGAARWWPPELHSCSHAIPRGPTIVSIVEMTSPTKLLTKLDSMPD